MKRTFSLLFVLTLCTMALASGPVRKSKTHYAETVLAPYVESGQLPGAISVFYNDGVQETCCIGYADVASKRIDMNSAYMQCSQTKGFCGVTIAKLVEDGLISLDDPVRQNASVAAASPLAFEPGTSICYSNTGIDIGAAVVRWLLE